MDSYCDDVSEELENLLIDHGALVNMVEAFKSDASPLTQRCLTDSLAKMVPADADISIDYMLNSNYERFIATRPIDITFSMDDGSQIGANRETLVEVCSVFKAMLEGHYRETDQDDINMPGVSAEAFQGLINFIMKGETPDISNFSIPVIMEMYGLADRYLLEKLKEHCSHGLMIKSYKAPRATVLEILEFSFLHSDATLTAACASLLLRSQMTLDEKVECMQLICNSTTDEKLVEILKKAVETKLFSAWYRARSPDFRSMARAGLFFC